MKKIVLMSLALAALSATAFAQGGSLYSRFGVGELRYAPTGQAAGMGYIGVGIADGLYINRLNPAMLSSIDQARIAGDFSYIGYAAQASTRSAYQTVVGFEGAGLAFPIWKLVVSTGLYPYSRMNYLQNEAGAFRSTAGDTIQFDYTYSGVGGLNTVPITIAAAPFSDETLGTLRLGASLNFAFGVFEEASESTFFPATFSNAALDREDRLSGVGYTLGVGYTSKRGLFSAADQLTLGAAFNSPVTLNGTRQSIVTTSWLTQNERRDTIGTTSGQAALPSSLALGISYRGNDTYVLGVDIALQNWSDFRYFNDDVSFRRNSLRVGVGGEVVQSQDLRAGFFQRAAYRAGVYYQQTNVAVQGTGIDEFGVTAGIGLPLAAESARLDLNLQYTSRGTTAQNLIRENIFRINVSLNIGERWFLQRKIE